MPGARCVPPALPVRDRRHVSTDLGCKLRLRQVRTLPCLPDASSEKFAHRLRPPFHTVVRLATILTVVPNRKTDRMLAMVLLGDRWLTPEPWLRNFPMRRNER